MTQERDMYKDRYNQLRSNAQQSGLGVQPMPVNLMANQISLDDLHYNRKPNLVA